MRRLMDKKQQQRDELNKLYNTRANLRLKYIAIGIMAVGIAIMLAIIIWMDQISREMMLLMRGCVGICAIVFVILCGIPVYRVNSAYWQQRGNQKNR